MVRGSRSTVRSAVERRNPPWPAASSQTWWVTPLAHPTLRHHPLRCPSGKTPRPWVNSPAQKYSTLPKFGNGVCIRHLIPLNGAYRDRHGTRGERRWTRAASRGGFRLAHMTGAGRVRQNRVVLAPAGWRQVLRSLAGRRGQECIAPRGERDISRKATAQGRPDVGLHLYAAVHLFFAHLRTADRGCPAGTRSSLRPLFPEGGKTDAQLGQDMPRGGGGVSESGF